MSDILDRAEALSCRDLAYDEWWDLSREMWPELIAEIKQQAAYVARLEAAYLKAAEDYYVDTLRFRGDVAKEHAREALERIKRGEQE